MADCCGHGCTIVLGHVLVHAIPIACKDMDVKSQSHYESRKQQQQQQQQQQQLQQKQQKQQGSFTNDPVQPNINMEPS